MRLMGRWIALLICLAVCLSMMACAKKDETEDGDEKAAPYSALYNGLVLTLGADATGLLDRLGEPNLSQEVFDCGAGNSRMCYRYASLTMYTMKTADGKEAVDQIEFNDDLVQTDEEISIGASVADVEAAYGTPSKKLDDEWTYTSGQYQLIFDLADGKVSGIGLLRKTN